MARWLVLCLSTVVATSMVACGQNDPAQGDRPAPNAAAVTGASSVPPASSAATDLLQPEIEALVVADLGARLNVARDAIQVVAASERTWPDRSLGCGMRRGVYEQQPVPGYQITLVHAAQTFQYHTDRRGAFVRCDPSGKPLDRIK